MTNSKERMKINDLFNFIFCTLVIISCKAQKELYTEPDYPYSEEFSEVYYGHSMNISDGEKESAIKRAGSKLSIYVYSKYEDSITLTINNRVIYEGKLAILSKNGHERLYLHIDKSNYTPFMVMKIFSHMNKEKMEFAIDSRFPNIILWRTFDIDASDPPEDWDGPLPYSWNISYKYSVGI